MAAKTPTKPIQKSPSTVTPTKAAAKPEVKAISAQKSDTSATMATGASSKQRLAIAQVVAKIKASKDALVKDLDAKAKLPKEVN